MQFSDSPSAANGGNLGWVNKGKLASPLETALNKMSSGDISEPIFGRRRLLHPQAPKTFDPQKDKPELPDEKQIRAFWKIKKMEVLSKKLLQELRQKAVIELRS